jgi:hypothetical protein
MEVRTKNHQQLTEYLSKFVEGFSLPEDMIEVLKHPSFGSRDELSNVIHALNALDDALQTPQADDMKNLEAYRYNSCPHPHPHPPRPPHSASHSFHPSSDVVFLSPQRTKGILFQPSNGCREKGWNLFVQSVWKADHCTDGGVKQVFISWKPRSLDASASLRHSSCIFSSYSMHEICYIDVILAVAGGV